MKKTLTRMALSALALSVLLSVPAVRAGDLQQTQCVPRLDRIASDAEVSTIVDLAESVSAELPTRTRVAQIEDPSSRLFLTRVLDHIETARHADELSPAELQKFSEEVQTTAASAQIGVQACAVQSAEIGEVSQAPRTAAVAANDCSCVEQCKNEWLDNMDDCDGSYWCEVGATLLFELCLADCLVPG